MDRLTQCVNRVQAGTEATNGSYACDIYSFAFGFAACNETATSVGA